MNPPPDQMQWFTKIVEILGKLNKASSGNLTTTELSVVATSLLPHYSDLHRRSELSGSGLRKEITLLLQEWYIKGQRGYITTLLPE